MTTAAATTLRIPARFHGPPASGNGGFTAGLVAAATGAPGTVAQTPVQVTLRLPPPLDTALSLVPSQEGWVLRDGDRVVAEASLGPALAPPPPAVSRGEAERATASYPGHRGHPFGTCYSCGPDRAEGDGLRIFPGRVGEKAGSGLVAAPWVTAPEVADPALVTPVVWAALDCVGGWSTDLEHRPLVLGRMSAVVHDVLAPGLLGVVVGEHRGTEGRKTRTASAWYDEDGRLLGQAEHVWIAVDPAAFGGS